MTIREEFERARDKRSKHDEDLLNANLERDYPEIRRLIDEEFIKVKNEIMAGTNVRRLSIKLPGYDYFMAKMKAFALDQGFTDVAYIPGSYDHVHNLPALSTWIFKW